MTDTETTRRKGEHLQIVVDRDVDHCGPTLLDDVRLLHQALPELELERLSTKTTFFGKELAAPLMIASMSGGARSAGKMNMELARAAQRCGVAFAVGSQRVMLESPGTLADFAVRSAIPDGVLLGNIGAVQLPEYTNEQLAELMHRIEADGLCIHLNPAQELIQLEGNRSFAGLADRIAALTDHLQGKVLVKETGAGLGPAALEQLRAAGVRCVDVAGAGGTSWTRVEMHRIRFGPERQIGETFADWGIPTAACVAAARKILGEEACVIASGGIRSGMDCARALALGADLAAVARPLLLAWRRTGLEGAQLYLERLKQELRCTMLLTGSADLRALREAPRIITGELRQWLQEFGCPAAAR